MKHLLTLVTLILACGLFAQDDEYIMYESIYLSPETENLSELRESMREHNKTYHSEEGPHLARVFRVTSGPDAGKLVWMMGPSTYSDFDDRPGADGHDEHWVTQVMPHVEEVSKGEFWKRDKELSNDVGDPRERPILLVRFLEVEKGQSYRVERILKQLSEAIKAEEGENPWYVYWNEWRQGYKLGRHAAIVVPFKSWSELDEDWSMKETFEKEHGEGSFETWMTEMDETFSDGYDEFWQFDAYMSGMPNE